MNRLRHLCYALPLGATLCLTSACSTLSAKAHRANQHARDACAAYFAHRIEVPQQKTIEAVCSSAEVIALFASGHEKKAESRAEEELKAQKAAQ